MSAYSFEAVIFDLDGVITKTAKVHSAAWKEAFDEYLRMRSERDGEEFKEFTPDDYRVYVDGKPRYEGVKSFLESREIFIPYGTPESVADEESVCGIGNRKNDKFCEVLDRDGAEIYTSTVEFIKQLKSAGVHVGVASSSKNCEQILKSAGLLDLFETRVDGVVSAELGLNGKPEGDIFIQAALNMGVHASKAVVVEDATSGVAAGRNGGFAVVLGIARENNTRELFANGADLVVNDMAEISLDGLEKWFNKVPEYMNNIWEKGQDSVEGVDSELINPVLKRSVKESLCGDKKPVFFLDYDGTLTPIVSRPEDAKISDKMRETVKRLIDTFSVTIVSGRCRDDVQSLLGIDGLVYAGSHGFDILGPNIKMINPDAQKMIPVIAEILEKLTAQVGDIPGAIIENKKFSMAVHYRLVDEEKYFEKIKKCCEEAIVGYDGLRLMHGKKVFEILPALDWDKGKAVRFVVKALGFNWDDVAVVYIGDDTTDEDAYRMIRTRGIPIHVSELDKTSTADFKVHTPDEVGELFDKLIEIWTKKS